MKHSDLFFKHFVDEGLGKSYYLIGSTENGMAAAIDPQRDVERYLQAAGSLAYDPAHVLSM